MLQINDLKFSYPDELVATQAVPRGQSRILHISRDREEFRELNWAQLSGLFQKGDTLVFNDSQVLWARLPITKASGSVGEVFFLKTLGGPKRWEVLSRGLNLKVGKVFELPGGPQAKVLKAGRISEIEVEGVKDLKKYFEEHGHVPLPPYIVNLREKDDEDVERRDRERYQNVWAKNWGSVAAPTAGLHFSEKYIEELKAKGVKIAYVTLHVGAGTFLPIDTENLNDFQIHSEVVDVGPDTCQKILTSQAQGKKVWACGTTVLRALETAVHASPMANSRLPLISPFYGETQLFVQPGYKFLVVEGLLTNFHQPESTLLALAAAFATRNASQDKTGQKMAVEKLLKAYQFAISKKYRLFSYGDLTVIS